MKADEKRWWGLTRFEWLMSILTLCAVVVAVLTGLIFLRQLHEMRTDERAWITMSSEHVAYPSDQHDPTMATVTVDVAIDNKGKTPARIFSASMVVDYVLNGKSPDFSYQFGVNHAVGIWPPQSPLTLTVPLLKIDQGSGGAVSRFLTLKEFEALSNGGAYMVIYGRANYLDIFGVKHWLHYCAAWVHSDKGPSITSKACSDYNDTDGN